MKNPISRWKIPGLGLHSHQAIGWATTEAGGGAEENADADDSALVKRTLAGSVAAGGGGGATLPVVGRCDADDLGP